MTSAANSGNILMGLGLEAILAQFANSETYYQNLTAIFGNQYDTSKAETLRIQWQEGDFSSLPTMEVLSASQLNGANGAFSAQTNRIYLSDAFLESASLEGIVNLLLEEIGHKIDSVVNTVDTAGDEGAIFAALVLGESLSAETLQALKTEEDTTFINVNGQIIAVEMQNFTGTEGNDSITGTSGNDVINGLGGNDTLIGGNGTDFIRGGNGDDSIDGGEGNDLSLEGGDGNDTLNGGAGNDNLDPGTGNGRVIGGAGEDSFEIDLNNESVGITITTDTAANPNNAIVVSEVEKFLIRGSQGNDSINLKETVLDTNKIFGRGGNDSVIGGGGKDLFFGEGGNDLLRGENNTDRLDGGDGDDLLQGGSGSEDKNILVQSLNFTSYFGGLYGGVGNDTLIGVDDTVANPGQGEIDYLEGGTGADRFVLGNTGWSGYDDGIVGDGTSSEPNEYGIGDYAAIADFNSGEGDIIQLQGVSADYNLVVLGTDTGILKVKPGTEADELIAIIRSRTGLSLTASYFNYVSSPILPSLSINNLTVVEGLNTNAVLTVNLNNPSSQAITVNYTTTPVTATANSDYTSTTGTLTIAANATTGTISIPILNDNLNESDETFTVILSNPVNATLGNTTGTVTITDTLQSAVTTTLSSNIENLDLTGTGNINGTGNAGNNRITGNSGNNILNGGLGNDTLIGGLGNDIYVVDTTTDTITELAAQGTDTIQSSVTYSIATSTNIENLDLTGTGNINGTGNAGNNRITGNSGNNILDGGLGNDTLAGNAGNDTLTGGAGIDQIEYRSTRAFVASDFGVDTISDFVVNQDKIVLSKTTFAALTSGVGNGFSQASNFAVVANNSLVAASNAFIVYSSGTGHLFYNQNGSAAGLGTGDNFAVLTGNPSLTANDFLLVA